MRLLVGFLVFVGFLAYNQFLIQCGRWLERGKQKRDALKQAGLTKDSRARLEQAARLMRDALYSSDYENPNLLNNKTADDMSYWLNDYKKEISR